MFATFLNGVTIDPHIFIQCYAISLIQFSSTGLSEIVQHSLIWINLHLIKEANICMMSSAKYKVCNLNN